MHRFDFLVCPLHIEQKPGWLAVENGISKPAISLQTLIFHPNLCYLSSTEYAAPWLNVKSNREGVSSLTDQHQTVFKGNIITVTKQRVTLPNGVALDMETVHHPGGAAIVAIDDRNQVCLLKQFRAVFKQWLWELPAGKRDHQEPPLTTARRELQEEAGIVAAQWQELSSMVSSPGVFGEQVYLYCAKKLTMVEQNQASDELIEIHWMPFERAYQWALDGTITDAKSVIGLVRAREYLSGQLEGS